jgi:hypothetical protein
MSGFYRTINCITIIKVQSVLPPASSVWSTSEEPVLCDPTSMPLAFISQVAHLQVISKFWSMTEAKVLTSASWVTCAIVRHPGNFLLSVWQNVFFQSLHFLRYSVSTIRGANITGLRMSALVLSFCDPWIGNVSMFSDYQYIASLKLCNTNKRSSLSI